MGRFSTEYLFQPEQHGEIPYDAWKFLVYFNCVEERGGAPGLHISDIGRDFRGNYGEHKGVELMRTTLCCGGHESPVETTLHYDRAMEAYFRCQLATDQHLEAEVREKCAEAYLEMVTT